MTLNTQRLLLSEIKRDDIELLHRLNCYPKVARFNTVGISKEISDTESLFLPVLIDMEKSERSIFHWIIRAIEGDFVGGFGLRLSAKRFKSAEIYYNLPPNHWGKG